MTMNRASERGSTERHKVSFLSGGTDCVAWHYPGAHGGCVIMAAGGAVPKEPGTDVFAARFQQAGFHVVAFDYRHLGESGGQPRQVVRIGEQLEDWDRAIATAATLPGVDPSRLAIWGFSVSGGHVFPVAARHPELAAAIAQSPTTDGPAAARNAARYTTVSALLRLTGRGILDGLGGLLGRSPLLVPTDGAPGTVAMLTSPDARQGTQALDPDGRHPGWQHTIAARSALRISMYRPGRFAARVQVPLLVVVADQDQSALTAPSVQAAQRAPRGELALVAGGHYAPFLDGHDAAVSAELSFLHRHVVSGQDEPVPQP